MSEERDDILYIPQGIKTVHEPVPGFGKHELRKLTILNFIQGLVLGFLIIIKIFTFAKGSFIFLLIAGCSIMFFRKSEGNLSMYIGIRKLIIFLNSQKVFKYKRLNEYE